MVKEAAAVKEVAKGAVPVAKEAVLEEEVAAVLAEDHKADSEEAMVKWTADSVE